MSRPTVGQVRRYDFQSDVFRGEYRLIEDLGGGKWTIEQLEPSPEIIADIEETYRGGSMSVGYHDPFGPERRRLTVEEAIEREVAERRERAGNRSTIQFVSREKWNEAF